jgi:hypothetical protein
MAAFPESLRAASAPSRSGWQAAQSTAIKIDKVIDLML